MTRAIPMSPRATAYRTRSLDAGPYIYVWIQELTQRRSESGRITNVVTAIAKGVGHNGNVELLGREALTADEPRAWADFLRELVSRGLSGVRVVTTGRHPGIEAAIAELLPGAVWQLGRDDVLLDLRGLVPKDEQALVAVLVNSIYSQPDEAAVLAQHKRVVAQLEERFPETAGRLAQAAPEMLAFARFPKEDWNRIWSNDPREPSNGLDRVTLRHQHANFFVVAPGHLRDEGNGVGRDRLSHSGDANIEVRAVVRERLVPAGAHLIALVRAPIKRLTAGVASGIETVANVFPRRSLARAHHPAAEATMPVPAWMGTSGVVVVLAAAFVAHAFNMFNSPRYELDEGTYVSSAWAVLHDQITAYPYGYGHPPLGWIQIAVWTRLAGGFFAFGNALNSGRVLMLLYASGSSCLIYVIARRMSGKRAIGLLAMVIFSFSPLSLAYQRQVFLDNIAVFWLLLSIYLIFASRSRFSYIVGAGLSFGLAVLSKETFVILVPVMIYALWLNITRYQRLFGLITFTYTVLALGFGLVLMALLRGELFPYAWHLPWDQHPHLSLLDTLAVQVHRSQSEGSFADSWYTWTHGDPLLMGLSVFATIFNLVVGVWKRNQLFLALAAISYWALLLRGGVVLSFYVILLIPLVALNAGLAINTVTNWMRRVVRLELAASVLLVGIAAGIVVNDISQSDVTLTQRPTSAQTESMVWVREHVPHDSVVIVNSYLYMDLRQPGGAGVGDGATYPDAHVYWNIAYDPELHDGLLQNDWDRIDYIVADSEMLRDITTAGGPMLLIDTALRHSILRQEYRADDNTRFCRDCPASQMQIVISIYQVIHRGRGGGA